MAGDDGLLRKGLVTHAKDGTAFGFCERCYKSVDVKYTHRCIPDAKNLGNQSLSSSSAKKKPVDKKKKSKRPPPTAFYIFMICFREIYKCDNPYVNVKDVAKLGGEKWKSFTNEEKKVYRDKAAELMEKYNKSLLDADDDDEEEDEEEETDDDEEKQADEVENKKDAPNGGQTGRGRGRRRGFRGRGSRGWLGVFG